MRPSTRHLVVLYAEMVAAMLAGMVLLAPPLAGLLGGVGVNVASWSTDAPELLLLGMATTMTIPMVAWMRFRQHRRGAAAEMAAAIFIPTLATIGALWAGLDNLGALLVVEHVLMLLGMLLAMLLRRDEYSGGTHRDLASGRQLTA